MTVLETVRLVLRPFDAADSAPLARVLGDEEVMRFSAGVMTVDEMEAWIARCIEGHRRSPGLAPLAAVERVTGDVVGYCGLERMDIAGRSEIELGYRLARAAQGRGLATEAACAVRESAFGALGLSRLVSLIDPANAASLRVAVKIGMSFEKAVTLAGYDHPDHLYAMERTPS